jgi:hypothetical protein
MRIHSDPPWELMQEELNLYIRVVAKNRIIRWQKIGSVVIICLFTAVTLTLTCFSSPSFPHHLPPARARCDDLCSPMTLGLVHHPSTRRSSSPGPPPASVLTAFAVTINCCLP